MNVTITNNSWNMDYTGYLDGKPVKVFFPPAQGATIELSFDKMSTFEMVDSKLFQSLKGTGLDVCRDWRDFH